MDKVRITSIRQLQDEVKGILKRLNDPLELALAAAANPLLALDELGFELAPDVCLEIEDRCRFGSDGIARRRQLRGQIFKAAGRSFDVSSPAAILSVLEELGLTRKDPGTSHEQKSVRPPRTGQHVDQLIEDLEQLKGAHQIVEPLLEYRRIDVSVPRFASMDLYKEVRVGRRKFPITGLQARLTG